MPRTTFIILCCLLAAPAQALQDPVAAALAVGEQAEADGRSQAAYEHYERATQGRPGDPQLVEHVLRVLKAEGDRDAGMLWAGHWYAAAANASGRANPSGKARKVLPADPRPAALAQARAGAVGELKSFAAAREASGSDREEDLLLAWWARRLALDLAQGHPALLESLGALADGRFLVDVSFGSPTLKALERQAKSLIGGGRTSEGLMLARTLHGICVQAGFQDLKGPRPKGTGRLRTSAGQLMGRARKRLRKLQGEPWTLDELDWLDLDQAEAFTRAHGSFGMPGLAISPEGLYRVETDCGFETLQGVTATIERHHRRLVNFYGQDPFDGRPGLVRIVPEAQGLEAEGAGFFWVGGFQGGDTTVMRFSHGTIEGLGHGLTHELTHRFDGAIYPGQPAWLTEGKASWTGSAYGHSRETEFVENHLNVGTLEGVWFDGYGRLPKLRDLITGQVEDYRDNYAAGYSLYVYLNTEESEEGRRLYQERLQGFMESARDGANRRVVQFERWFCDGKNGRPLGLEAFAETYDEFLSGAGWKEPGDWRKRYTSATPPVGPQPYVYDEPTWTWTRSRTEPYFGDGGAGEAARLFEDLGQSKMAARAYIWSLCTDGRLPVSEQHLARLLVGMKRPHAAWVMSSQLRFPGWPAEEPAPFLNKLPRTRALLKKLKETAAEFTEELLPSSAGAMLGDALRLARWLGEPELDLVTPTKMARGFDASPRPMADQGWLEDELTGYDKNRKENLWFEGEYGDVILGRRVARRGTGRVDRRGGGKTFVRGKAFQVPGTYRIRTRVRFTTVWASGSIVLGWTRRDRNVRVNFTGGSYRFANGEPGEEPAFERVNWSISGLRSREGPLGSNPKGVHKFESPRNAFDLELLVDGGAVQVFLNGEPLGTYHTALGEPIEGFIGFATSAGAIRFGTPTIQRLDRARSAGRPGLAPVGLDLTRGESPSFGTLENRPVHGLEPSTQGTLLLWIPTPNSPARRDRLLSRARTAAERLASAARREAITQPIVVALPDGLDAQVVAQLTEEWNELFDVDPKVIVHHLGLKEAIGRARQDGPADLGKRWLIFLDAGSVARVVAPFFASDDGFDKDMEHWLRVFRDNGSPLRELPEVQRPDLTDEGD